MSGLLGLLGSIGTSLISNRGAKRRQQQADQQNIKFWEMQNKYNTPKQQMQRLKDAGLNPALIYGSGQTNTGVAGSVAPSKPAPYNVKDPIPSLVQTQLLGAQKALLDEQRRKLEIENNQKSLIYPEDVKIKQQKAIQEALNTAILSKTEKAKAQLVLENLLQQQQNTKNVKSRTEYEIRLRKMGISPTGSTGVNILKALMLGAQYIKDQFLNNPQEPTIKRNNSNR